MQDLDEGSNDEGGQKVPTPRDAHASTSALDSRPIHCTEGLTQRLLSPAPDEYLMFPTLGEKILTKKIQEHMGIRLKGQQHGIQVYTHYIQSYKDKSRKISLFSLKLPTENSVS